MGRTNCKVSKNTKPHNTQGEVIQDEEISNVLKEQDDQNLTMFKIIRAMSNYLNNKIENERDLSKVLGKGYKENEEEDNQVMQTLLNMNERRLRGLVDTSQENMNQKELTESNGMYPSLTEIKAREYDISRSTLKMDETYTLKGENSSKTNKQEKHQHSKGKLSSSTPGYVENIEKIIEMTIKTMRQENVEKDDNRSKDINDEEMKRIMNKIKKGMTAEKNESKLNKDQNRNNNIQKPDVKVSEGKDRKDSGKLKKFILLAHF